MHHGIGLKRDKERGSWQNGGIWISSIHPHTPWNVNLNNYLHAKILSQEPRSPSEVVGTWVRHRNKKQCIEEGRKDQFTLPLVTVPQTWAAQQRERQLLHGKKTIKWALLSHRPQRLPTSVQGQLLQSYVDFWCSCKTRTYSLQHLVAPVTPSCGLGIRRPA